MDSDMDLGFLLKKEEEKMYLSGNGSLFLWINNTTFNPFGAWVLDAD